MSIQEKNVSVEALCDYLFGFTGLLSCEKRSELQKANNLSKMFRFLKTECSSFWNYDIFEHILDHYKVDRQDEDLKYPEKLKSYVESHNIAEFIKDLPVLSKYTPSSDSVKLNLVLNIDELCKLDKFFDIARSVANIMGLLPSKLHFYNIKKSCVEVIFLIPKSAAESIFTGVEIFSEIQQMELRGLHVQQVQCHGYTINLNHNKTPTATGNVLVLL